MRAELAYLIIYLCYIVVVVAMSVFKHGGKEESDRGVLVPNKEEQLEEQFIAEDEEGEEGEEERMIGLDWDPKASVFEKIHPSCSKGMLCCCLVPVCFLPANNLF